MIDTHIRNVDEPDYKVTNPNCKVNEASGNFVHDSQQDPVFIKLMATLNDVLRAPQRELAPAQARSARSSIEKAYHVCGASAAPRGARARQSLPG